MAAKRWDGEIELGHQAVQRPDFADIPDIAAAIMRGVRIENLAPCAGKRHPDAVIVIYIRREIHDYKAAGARIIALAHPGEHVAAGIVGHDPFEAGWIAVQLDAAPASDDRAC
jgi:hypothetical protein